MDWDLKNFMVLQSVLEVLLLVLLLAVLVRTGKRGGAVEPTGVPEKLSAGVERFLTESEKIAKTFQATLRDKKDLTADLILKLDRRLAEYRELLAAVEAAVRQAEKRLEELGGAAKAGGDKANPAAPEVRALVLQLSKKGLSVEDIAVRSRLHRGEVELIIDLEHQFGL
ncbi:MAG: hypothetical protein LBU12_03360 [Deltaproteobacteria bacterium]|nr:hypothetical protein [Deltaproteobacteria bacterium]